MKNFSHWLKNRLISDEEYSSKRFQKRFGFKPNFKNPQTFNEKINSLKLSNDCYKLALFVDKLLVQSYIRDLLGKDYLVPCLGAYEKFDRKLFDSLPEKFVIKGSHGSAMNYLVHQKKEVDYHYLKKLTSKWLAKNFYLHGREKAYRYLKPRLIIEELMEDEKGQPPPDYKFYCFNGNPKFIHVDFDRFNGHRRNLYDMNGKLLPVKYKKDIDFSKKTLSLDLSIFKETVEKLASPFKFVRVDLYLYKEQIKFGEFTFTPINGFGKIEPEIYDKKFGDLLEIGDDYSFFRQITQEKHALLKTDVR